MSAPTAPQTIRGARHPVRFAIWTLAVFAAMTLATGFGFIAGSLVPARVLT